jgi:hypothetical protein
VKSGITFSTERKTRGQYTDQMNGISPYYPVES